MRVQEGANKFAPTVNRIRMVLVSAVRLTVLGEVQYIRPLLSWVRLRFGRVWSRYIRSIFFLYLLDVIRHDIKRKCQLARIVFLPSES